MFSASRVLIWVILIFSVLQPPRVHAFRFNFSGDSHLAGIVFPTPLRFNSAAETGCRDDRSLAAEQDHDYSTGPSLPPAKLQLKHHVQEAEKTKKEALLVSAQKDMLRIQTLFRRITEKKSQSPRSPIQATGLGVETKPEGRLSATVESGVALGSGEYFIDVFIGTPPRHFSLILDTGSDLNWVQCVPCHACFEQRDQSTTPVHHLPTAISPAPTPAAASSLRRRTPSLAPPATISHPLPVPTSTGMATTRTRPATSPPRFSPSTSPTLTAAHLLAESTASYSVAATGTAASSTAPRVSSALAVVPSPSLLSSAPYTATHSPTALSTATATSASRASSSLEKTLPSSPTPASISHLLPPARRIRRRPSIIST
ncbi:hypothetical protein HPP92_002948 [Vanilla planifolia]|uniref:Peptidase A1 domain-containing protein n=1 Tax=Vanilla planifolia TaxID=51239 RepID=A0A835S7B6_VANPL|nr:hypothetical protein HPP92_002948 [Vanilla planifolia]